MDPSEIRKLAEEIAALDIPGTLHCASRMAGIADHIQGLAAPMGWEDGAPFRNLEAIGDSAWWAPPRNLVAHKGRHGWGFWSFTILPLFANRCAFREDLNGIVIRPAWRLASDKRVGKMSPRLASSVADQMSRYPTLAETIGKEVAWIEGSFGVKVPDGITAGLLQDVEGQARRRWGMNKLKAKDRLIPFDGSKPRDLGPWE